MKYLLSTILLLCASAMYADDYPVNAGKTAEHTNAKRALSSIILKSPSVGEQTIAVNQASTKMLYYDKLDQSLAAHAGDTLTASVTWNSTWMNSYIYIDFGNDGQFDCSLNENGTPTDSSDVVAYSYYNDLNSAGDSLASTGGDVLAAPSFVLPADMKPGVYRIRYKIDWDCIDAGGSTVTDNDIVKNGGAIVDTRLVVLSGNESYSLYADGKEISTGTAVTYGQPIEIDASTLIPENSITSSIVVRHGYNLDGDSLVCSNPQYIDNTMSYRSVADGKFTIPASMVDGNVVINLYTTPLDGGAGCNVNTTPDAKATISGLSLTQLRIAGTRTRSYSSKTTDLAYQDFSDKSPVPVRPGLNYAVTLTGTYTADGVKNTLSLDSAMLLVDVNNDGYFTPAIEAMPSAAKLTVPDYLENGYYAARLYFPGIGAMADFTIYVHPIAVSLNVESFNSRVTGKSVYDASCTEISSKGVPSEVAAYHAASFYAQPLVSTGFSASDVQVRVTKHDGTVSHFNVRLSKPSYTFTIPADSICGDVDICVDFEMTSSNPSATQRQAVLVEEFNGDEIDSDLWTTSTRYNAAWNRFIVDDPRVAFVEDGSLVCRCFANPGDIADYDRDMVSGAKETQGHFAFNHGYVEARIFTTQHTGNFPAFWLMPADQTDGWPTCGEIDIWETINTETRAYNTIHSHWSYDLGNGGNGGNYSCDHVGQWHTFGLLKEADKLTWYIDGDKTFSYTKSTDESALSQGQWPFDKAFYIILNQSVGNGSWASNPDKSFTYETKFDWVRVYQTSQEAADDSNEITGISQASQTPANSPVVDKAIYDLNGRKLAQPIRGQFYIQNGKVHLAR